MLTFSKEREPELLPSDLNKTIGEVVELAQSRAEELGVTVEWHPDEAIPTLTFDPEGIHRAVLNIATNAVDACENKTGAKVVIASKYVPDETLVRITVEDNGVGIAQEDLDKIFTVFVSGKGSIGTGLGLSVSQKILKEHGGNIHVTSTLGAGSRFTLELPAVMPGTSSDGEGPEGDTGEIDKPEDPS